MPAPTHVTVSPRSFACNLATICAPTLAGLKPASLFRYQPASGQDGTAMAVAWHALLAPRGVTVRVLKACPVTGAVLVYVYRPTQVAAILQRGDVQDFLQSEGYTPGNAESMLAQLSQRLCCEEDFPHEIGVFLGYPLADVIVKSGITPVPALADSLSCKVKRRTTLILFGSLNVIVTS